MKMVKVFVPVMVSLLALTSFAWAGDWEYWSQYGVKVPLDKKVALHVKPQFRFKKDMSDFYYHKTYVGPSVKVDKYFDMAAYYAFLIIKSKGKWKEDHLATLDLTPKYELWTLKFSDRNRFEHTFNIGVWKYRNCIKVKKTFKSGNYNITPFASDEIFYNFNTGKLDENRVSVGVSTKLFDSIDLSVSYLLKSKEKNGDWKDTNVLVTGFSFSF